MNAGKMDKLVTIERNSSTVNSNHAVVDSWVEIGTAWFDIKTPTAKELREGQNRQHNTIEAHSWPIDITHNDRFIYAGDTYRVIAVIDKTDYYLIKAEMNEPE
jgi:SPP1 family predicted phage head-tail adaptor